MHIRVFLVLKAVIFIGTPHNIYKEHIKIIFMKFGHGKSILKCIARGFKSYQSEYYFVHFWFYKFQVKTTELELMNYRTLIVEHNNSYKGYISKLFS